MSTRREDTSPPLPVLVIGGGPAGLAAALLLARARVETMLLAPEPPLDARTTALMQGSLEILEGIGVWPALREASGPLRHLRMLDDTRRLVRAPEVTFHASELKLDAFGWNIPNTALTAALRDAALAAPHLTLLAEKAADIEAGDDAVTVTTERGTTLRARLLVAADGRHSLGREAAGIGAREWRHDQSALVLNLVHDVPHGDVSTEFHTGSGPFTLVPLPGKRSSLVAVLRPGDGEKLKALDDAALGAELTRRSHRLLGELCPDGPRGLIPLGGLVARRFAARRVALVGEAGHVMPPIGAQGLNLGLRDAAAIARLAAEAAAMGADPGAATVMTAYDRKRRADVWSRTAAVEALNRSLLAGFLPFDMARGAGLAALAQMPVLRRFAMRQGLGLGG